MNICSVFYDWLDSDRLEVHDFNFNIYWRWIDVGLDVCRGFGFFFLLIICVSKSSTFKKNDFSQASRLWYMRILLIICVSKSSTFKKNDFSEASRLWYMRILLMICVSKFSTFKKMILAKHLELDRWEWNRNLIVDDKQIVFIWKFWCMTVNRNLVGAGCLTTDQKKKLLWGGKRSTPTEEVFYIFLFLAAFLPLHMV